MSKKGLVDDILVVPNYWEFERIVAWSFNRLKGKTFNLIEASIVDKKQQEAVKGLIKGFANDEYKTCIEEMRFNAEAMQLADINIAPMTAEPLENKLGIYE